MSELLSFSLFLPIFASETDIGKFKDHFVKDGEKEGGGENLKAIKWAKRTCLDDNYVVGLEIANFIPSFILKTLFSCGYFFPVTMFDFRLAKIENPAPEVSMQMKKKLH